jgi:hypothetical protein
MSLNPFSVTGIKKVWEDPMRLSRPRMLAADLG